jgi:hypothetical protein
MSTQDQITYSEVQLERCESTLKMFMRKFSEGNKTFPFERQMHIINSWTDAVDGHKLAIKTLTKKLN